uniref:FERM and PDZ domain containing 2 n=1 Tax=Astyanax mexicanus TaxID=7994 RepID=A0A8B9LHU8_ASTMX
ELMTTQVGGLYLQYSLTCSRLCVRTNNKHKQEVIVYSLGMTLYWSVDYHLPQNQPIPLSDSLNCLLLSMCEDMAHRRVNLNTILESCESHHKTSLLPPPNKVIRQLVEDLLCDISFKKGYTNKFHLIELITLHFQSLGPEFARMVDEPQIVLELPGSIVSKKGKSCLSQREVSVVMPNEQCVTVRCDIKSRGRDVFDMVVAHANLVEHFYFGLAFLDDDEFFFLDHETKISKVAPDTWKKLATSPFTLFLRVKFFADDVTFILHKLTRHQYYLQLRRDILEDRVHCNEDTAVYLAALALQAEFGDYMDEVYGRNYFQTEHYIPKRVMEKIALPCLREELPRLHANNAQMLPEEAEMEFLKIAQQLPEYGVLFHRVARERKPVIGDLTLGVCAKGIMVYEVKNNSRTLIRRFQWSETDNISTTRRKFTIECSPSGKKHSFLTESSKIAQYLLSLCSAQHKFHSEMTSRQLTTLASGTTFTVLFGILLLNTMISKDFSWSKNKSTIKHSELNQLILVKLVFLTADTPVRTPPEREIICVTLKKDPKLGFGKIGEDNTGKLDLGIFIASVVPDGPADKDGRIRPGGRLISLNKISLEGVTFSAAAAILQNSPDEVEIIVSQPKRKFECSGKGTVHIIIVELWISCLRRLCLNENEKYLFSALLQETFSRSSSSSSLRPGELLGVELRKVNGSLGISVAGGINTNIRYGGIYIKSLIPGGAADQDGRIQIGDRLLEVDSCNLRSVTHRQAVECLKKTGEVLNHHINLIHILTNISLKLLTLLSCYPESNTLEVTLKKSPKGLGFSFLITDLRHEGGSVVRIRRLFPGQPAEQCGLLRQGDVILAVNGEPLREAGLTSIEKPVRVRLALQYCVSVKALIHRN